MNHLSLILGRRARTRRVHAGGALLLALGAVFALTLVGCSSDPSPSAAAGPANAGKAKAGATANAAATDSAAGKMVASTRKSVFHVDPQFGRDPFFPGSSRATAKADAPAVRLPLISYLRLVGIRPGTTRPMALINRTALGPGEEASVSIVVSNQPSKLEMQKVNVKCVEIRRESVLISIEGEEGVKELPLAQAK
jgi:hypothetical protein